MNVTRQEVVEFARSCKDIPYQHQGRSKLGVDCAGILVMLGKWLGEYSESKEARRYSRDPASFSLKKELARMLISIDKENIDCGDILLLKILREPQHVGIVTDYSEQSFGMVHCYQSIGRVVEHRLNRFWLDRIVQVYQIPGVQ